MYSTITNLLCTGTAADLTSCGSLFGVGAVDLCAVLVSLILGLIGTKAAFSAVRFSSGGGRSLPRDRNAAMAVFVSSWLAFTVNVPIVSGSASVTVKVEVEVLAVEVEVEALASVKGTCTGVSLVVVTVFPVDRVTSFCAFCGLPEQFLMVCAIGLAYGTCVGVRVLQLKHQV